MATGRVPGRRSANMRQVRDARNVPRGARSDGGGLLRLRLHTPELETLLIDRLLNRGTGEIVRRSALGRDHADRVPGTEMGGQLAAGRIAGERAQFLVGVRLENVDSHGPASFRRRGIIVI